MSARFLTMAEATYEPGALAPEPLPASPPDRVLSRADWTDEAVYCLRRAIDAGGEDADAERLREHASILDMIELGLRERA
jgi:hypothetical protein